MAIEAIGGNALSYQAVAGVSTKPAQKVKEAEGKEIEIKEVGAANDTAAQRTDRIVKKDDNSTGNSQEDASKKQQEQNEKIRKSVEEINKKLSNNTECQFGIHEATNRITIKIVDKDTKEVVQEVPAEKTLEMIAKVWEVAGILVDEKR